MHHHFYLHCQQSHHFPFLSLPFLFKITPPKITQKNPATKPTATATLMFKPQLLNPARLGGSTRWLDRSGFNKRPAVAIAWPNPGDPAGRPRTRVTRANPDETWFFFSFQMWDLKPISIYTLCFHEKNHVFSMWDKNFLV